MESQSNRLCTINNEMIDKYTHTILNNRMDLCTSLESIPSKPLVHNDLLFSN